MAESKTTQAGDSYIKALTEIEHLLSGEISDLTPQGRRRYLAYLLAKDALKPGNGPRQRTIRDLREVVRDVA